MWTGVGAQLARDVPFSGICWSVLEPVSLCFPCVYMLHFVCSLGARQSFDCIMFIVCAFSPGIQIMLK